MMQPTVLFIHALSPLHAGVGQGIGAVDLPIARDRATNMPFLPGSSLKGALRARASEVSGAEHVRAVFGPDAENASDHAGSLLVGDANLLLLPVRSFCGTFAWVTSPYLLGRFKRDCHEAGLKPEFNIPKDLEPDKCLTTTHGSEPNNCKLAVAGGKQVVLEDLDLNVSGTADDVAGFLAEHLFPTEEGLKAALWSRLCIVHDDVMQFLAENATQVDARVALEDESKTVRNGHLWYEESLPTESVLVSLVAELPLSFKGRTLAAVDDVLRRSIERPLLLGGKVTVGRGRSMLYMAGGKQ